MTAPVLKLIPLKDESRSISQRDLPAELSELFAAADEVTRGRAWAAFLERYSALLVHAASLQGRSYDRVMERYTYVLDQLRRDDFRRLLRFQAGGESAFSTWLVVVVRRLCVDFHRQRYGRSSNDTNRREAPSRGESRRRLEDLVSDAEDLTAVPDLTRGTITREYTTHERHRALVGALETLDPADRRLLELRFEDGLTLKQIAQATGSSSQSQVHRRLESVLSELRAKLERAGIDPS
jgi:RNA polymerase sigma factor (sigma-70 family)